MSIVIPLILSGGEGTRLWPVSRASKPKQFLPLTGTSSLFQSTLLRCSGPTFSNHPIVVGGENHRFLIAEALAELGMESDILLEPFPRNSCAAIAAGCLQALKRDPEAIVLALAADHHIPDAGAFESSVSAAVDAAMGGQLVTFGVKPDRPSQAYGYIRPGAQTGAACKVDAFVEKPDAESAQSYLEQGYLWNSGNFLLRAATFIGELGKHQPEILDKVTAAFRHAATDLDFIRLDAGRFADVPSISVDYAVMEKTDCAAVLPVDYRWSDIGSWDAVADLLDHDADGNAIAGPAYVVGGKGNLVFGDSMLTGIVGLNDIVVVTTRDAVLVAAKSRAESVKQLVDGMRANKLPQADSALQVFRPWGNYEQLDIAERYQVKRIVVKPGEELSLQKHRHRAEHWVVVYGTAEITIGDKVSEVHPNQSVYVPLGEVHRLANRGKVPVVLIEVQTGDYLGEDDIIRLEDRYNRSEPALR